MKILVLDHGYVEFVESWGHGKSGEQVPNMQTNDFEQDFERGIIEAARQSTQGSFRGWERGECSCDASELITGAVKGLSKEGDHKPNCPYITQPGDARLLKFLFSNHHDTPFEFAGMVIEVQAPIFVFREWQRHRTQSYNEMSARYEPLPDLYYEPDPELLIKRIADAKSNNNKQAGGAIRLTSDLIEARDAASQFVIMLNGSYRDAEFTYRKALELDIPKELARLSMPVGHYSRMRASTNLRNWLAFLTLRLDPKAQWEIRQFAKAVAQIIEQTFPRTYQLFVDRVSKGD